LSDRVLYAMCELQACA